jgi:hypothetical protein
MVDANWWREFRAALNAAFPGNSRWDSGEDWATRSQGVCDDQLMADIVNDNRGGPSTYSSPLPKAASQQTTEPQDGSGWRDAPAIKPPEGVALVDKLVDMQDRLDAVARAHQMGLSYSEWQKLSEKDIEARKEQQAKKVEGKK